MAVDRVSYARYALLLACLPACNTSASGQPSSDTSADADLPFDTCENGEQDEHELCHVEVATTLPSGDPVVGDFTGAGRIDPGSVVILQNGEIRLAFGQLSGVTLVDPREIVLPSKLDSPKTALVAELDGEVGTDVIVINQETGETETFLNHAGMFKPGSSSVLEGGPWNYLEVVDLNGDGLLDLVAEPNYEGNMIYLYRNGGGGELTAYEHHAEKFHEECFVSASAQLGRFGDYTGGIMLGAGECNELPASTVGTAILAELPSGPNPWSGFVSIWDFGAPSDIVVGEFKFDLIPYPEVFAWDKAADQLIVYDAFSYGFGRTAELSLVEFCPECPPDDSPDWLRLASGSFGGAAGDDITFQIDDSRIWIFDPLREERQAFVTDLPVGPASVADLNADGIADLVVQMKTGETGVIASNP